MSDELDLAGKSVVVVCSLAGLVLWGRVEVELVVAPVLVVLYGVFPAGRKIHRQWRM